METIRIDAQVIYSPHYGRWICLYKGEIVGWGETKRECLGNTIRYFKMLAVSNLKRVMP